MSAVEHYIAQHDQLKTRLPGSNLPWLNSIRQQALNSFRGQGFPSTRLEDWKYTRVSAIEKRDFVVDPGSSERHVQDTLQRISFDAMVEEMVGSDLEQMRVPTAHGLHRSSDV